MKSAENKKSAKDIENTPMSELTNYHRQIELKYQHLKPEEIKVNPDAMALMAFNGYYTLSNAKGAFFAVDTNIHFQNGSSTPIYDLALLVSLDGKTSARFPFSGTFDGTHLVQTSAALEGLTINLTLSRTDGSDGTTAKCSGTIALPLKSPVQISGSTYNNPIPVSLFAGEYYETAPIHLSPDNKKMAAIKVMQIKDNHQVLYDYGTNDGNLKPVPAYTYNLNMYYFTFAQGTQTVNLIMGTAAEGGFACNNMTTGSPARSLQTIPFPVEEPFELPNILSEELAAFSGYYQLPSIAPGAFISIQAEYAAVDGLFDLYMVKIGVSLNGTTSKGYYFDGAKMTFQNNTLTMLEQNIGITFKREYNAARKSLVTITGSVMGHENVTGFTLFNPVPLSVFGGVPMTDAKGDSLTVVSDAEVIYNGTTMNNILYVPIMYILANPWNAPTTVMSFGTAGLNGNACIVIDGNGTSVVSAIHNGAQN